MKLDSEYDDTVTIWDVAREAGVSIKTVSRVTNKQPNVRGRTRIKVQKVINQLGYSANPKARYLGSLPPRPRNRHTQRPAAASRQSVKQVAQEIDWW